MAQIRAISSNSAYYEAGDDGKALRAAVDNVNQEFDAARLRITDPGREARVEREMLANPLFAAGIRGFENMKWDLEAGLDPFAKHDR